MVNNRDWHDSNQSPHGEGDGSYDGRQVYGGGDYYGQQWPQEMPALPELPQDALSEAAPHAGHGFLPAQGFQESQGTDEGLVAEQSAAGMLGFDEDAPAEDPKRRRGIVWVVAILAVLLLAAGGAWLVFFNNTTEAADTVFNFDGQQKGPVTSESAGIELPLVADPTETVREYLTAIAEGDSTAAGAYADPGVSLVSGDALSVEALGSAKSRISIASVELVEEHEGSASVRATMSLEGSQFEHVFALNLVDTEVDGKTKKTWSISEPLVAAIDISATGLHSVSIGDHEVGIDPNGGSQRVYVYPGAYNISGNAGEYFSVSGGSQAVTVTTPGNTSASVHFSTTPNAAFEQAVLAQVQERISLCTDVSGNMDDECPSITRNTQLEELTVTQSPAGFDSISANSFVSSRGEIGVVDTPTSGNPEPKQRTSGFNVYGDISIVDGHPQISNVRSY